MDTEDIKKWIRPPKPGEVCPYTGLKRGSLLNLVKARKVKACSLRQPGRKRGNRLIWLPSVFQYFDKLAETQANEGDEETAALPGPEDA